MCSEQIFSTSQQYSLHRVTEESQSSDGTGLLLPQLYDHSLPRITQAHCTHCGLWHDSRADGHRTERAPGGGGAVPWGHLSQVL